MLHEERERAYEAGDYARRDREFNGVITNFANGNLNNIKYENRKKTKKHIKYTK